MTGVSSSLPSTSPQFRPWREIAILALMVMEVSWVTPWFRSLTPAAYAIPAWRVFLIFLGIILAAHLTARLLAFLKLRTRLRQGITLALLAASILIGLKMLLYPHESVPFFELLNRPLRSLMDWKTLIPDEFVIIVVVLIGWWRGIALAQEHIGPGLVQSALWTGVGMFVAFVFINTLVTGEEVGNVIYLFLVSGLLAMAAARLAVVRTLRGGRQSTFDRRWLLGVIAAALLVVGLAAVAGQLANDSLQWVGYVLLGLFGFLAVLVWLVFSPLLALVIYLAKSWSGGSKAVSDLVNNLVEMQEGMREFISRISTVLEESGIIQALQRSMSALRSVFLWGIVAAVVAGVVLWVAMQLWKDRPRRKLDEEQQSLLGQGDLWRLLQAALRKRMEGLKEGLANIVDLRRRQRERAAARIRQVYADLLDLCVTLGHPRPDAHTPLEFLPDLQAIFPALDAETGTITQAYLRVRYGQLPERREEVEEVEQAWKQISEVGKEQLAEKKKGTK